MNLVSDRGYLKKIYELPGAEGRYSAMEGMRAFAAIAVFFVHFNANFLKPENYKDWQTKVSNFSSYIFDNILLILSHGHYGVDLFFMLSGFLIARMVTKQSFRYGEFMFKRFCRIYPAFLVSLIIYAAYYVFVFGYDFWPGKFVGNLFLLHGIPGLNFPPYNFVTWSLWYEFFFYIFYPATIIVLIKFGLRHWLWAVILGGVAILVIQFLFNIHVIRFVYFYFGVILAFLPREQTIKILKKIPSFIVEIVLITSIILLSYNKISYLIFLLLFGSSAMIVIYKSLYIESTSMKFFSLCWFRWLGNISYSFYLFHPIAIWMCFAVFSPMDGINPLTAYILKCFICFLTSIVVATIVFYYVEKPYFTLKKRIAEF